MAADNQTTIAGNWSRTPNSALPNTGTPVTNLRRGDPAHPTRRRVADGETSFFKVNVWRGQAEHLADSFPRATGSWSPAGSGSGPGRPRRKRSVAEIEAEEVGPASSSPPPRSNAPTSGPLETAPRGGSGRPNAAATSTTSRHSDQSRLSAPGSRRGRFS